MTKLYDIPRQSKILLPISDGKTTTEQLCTFITLDGMYSVIKTPDNHIVHLSVQTPLIKRKDYYEIEEPSHE